MNSFADKFRDGVTVVCVVAAVIVAVVAVAASFQENADESHYLSANACQATGEKRENGTRMILAGKVLVPYTVYISEFRCKNGVIWK